jgi:hypothetical protein
VRAWATLAHGDLLKAMWQAWWNRPKVDTTEVVILEKDQIVRLLKHVRARTTLHPILMLALALQERRLLLGLGRART